MKKTKLGEFEELVTVSSILLIVVSPQVRKVLKSNPVNGLKVE